MVYVGLEVRLEGLERVPVPPPEELVLEVPEHLLGRPVVDAVALARHALGEAVAAQGRDVEVVLVLPPHVRVHDGARALRLGRHERLQHLLLLGEVRVLGDRPRHDLLAPEVVRRREVGPAEGELELGDVGAQLLPGPVGGEVAADHVLEGLADGAPVRAVPVAVGLLPDAAPQAHLVHHLEHRLVRYPHAVHGPELHRDLAVADPVRQPPEDLGDARPELGPGRGLRVREGVVVAGPGEARRLEQVGERVALP